MHEDLHASQPQLIRYRPAAQAFVTQLIAMGKDVRLVTNAHRASLAIKHRATGIEHHLPAVYSAHDFGYAKEGQQFWQQLQTRHHFHPQRTLMVDDTEVVLDAARLFGIAHTVAVTTPDSSAVPRVFQRHTGITHFAQLFPASTLAASTSSDW